jgi:hypothetical protein
LMFFTTAQFFKRFPISLTVPWKRRISDRRINASQLSFTSQ